MIRINLLPFRAARKKENVKRQISIFALTIILAVLGMVYVTMQLNSELAGLKEEEKKVQAEMAALQKIINEISRLEKEIKEIRTKLGVIKELEKNKTGPVHLLDEISKAVPKEKLWLRSMSESKGSLALQGTAMDNGTVALFMTNLERSDFIHTVELQSTVMRNIPEFKLRVSDFVLDAKTYAAKKEEPKPKK